MKILILIVAASLWANVGWAGWNGQLESGDRCCVNSYQSNLQVSTELTKSIDPYEWEGSTAPTPILNWISSDTWVVSKGFEGSHKGKTFTLAEFVSSGKFCKARGGHQWLGFVQRWYPCTSKENRIQIEVPYPWPCGSGEDWCLVCHHCRQHIKVNRQFEEWEP